MAATLGLQEADYRGKKIVEDTGTSTGALRVIVEDSAADEVATVTSAAAVTAGTTSSTLLAANTNRKNAVFTNYGATGAFIRRGTPAVAGQGIYLAPNGGTYEINQTNLYKGIVTCITASGTTTIAVEEGV
jgi:hypothetical protein